MYGLVQENHRMGDIMEYFFYDTDIFNTCNEEYDISGYEYLKLLTLCEKYCCYFSLCFGEKSEYIEIFTPFELPDIGFTKSENYCKIERNSKMKDLTSLIEIGRTMYFKITEKTIKLLMTLSDSIFGLPYLDIYKTTADLAFYRSDKSTFFSSTTHEGICTLFPTDNENVESIISNSHWTKSRIINE